ncbi:MAG: TlpA disulfide reductase family protein [Syntrophales bacterium]|nr:TlpA disulfide reductase family protein [Syntrophales bacterium]
MKDKKPILFLVFFVIITVVVILLQEKDSLFNLPPKSRLQPGFPAPDFVFPGLDGKTVRLADYKGKVVFLNIWATWCPPCREEMPSMERLYKELKGQAFEILAVSIDASGAKVVAPFMKEYHLSFPVLLDPAGATKSLYGTTGVPESFIINKEGLIEQIIIGPMDWATPDVVRFFRDLIQKR